MQQDFIFCSKCGAGIKGQYNSEIDCPVCSKAISNLNLRSLSMTLDYFLHGKPINSKMPYKLLGYYDLFTVLDDGRIAVVVDGNTIQVWNPKDGSKQGVKCAAIGIYSLVASGDSLIYAAVQGGIGRIKIHDLSKSSKISERGYRFCILKESKLIALYGDKKIILVDDKGKRRRELTTTGQVTKIVELSANKFISINNFSRNISLWDLTGNNQSPEVFGNPAVGIVTVNDVIALNDHIFATVDSNGVIMVWDVKTQKRLKTSPLGIPGKFYKLVCFSSRYLVVKAFNDNVLQGIGILEIQEKDSCWARKIKSDPNNDIGDFMFAADGSLVGIYRKTGLYVYPNHFYS